MFEEKDQGDGTLTLSEFKKVMKRFKIKDKVLESAIAQITLVSQDINHLNY